VGDELGLKVLESLKDKNIDLLAGSGKDLDLLAGVYGEEVLTAKEATAGATATAGQATAKAGQATAKAGQAGQVKK